MAAMFSQKAPLPRPSSKRPPLSTSIEAAALAIIGWGAERQVGHVGRQPDALGARRQVGEQREGVEKAALVGVVLDPDQVEPGLLGGDGLLDGAPGSPVSGMTKTPTSATLRCYSRTVAAVYRHLTVEEHGDVALVRIDRPPANAMDLEAAWRKVPGWWRSSVPPIRARAAVVVITGRDGFFSAGVDLKVAPQLDADGQRAMVTGINRLFGRWYGFPRPLVCAVNGHAIAGGLILALCGDHRVGARQGKLGVTELRAGIPYPAVAMWW